MDLRHITKESIPHALVLAERYRLLNEPEQAASIYCDVLAVDPTNERAHVQLFLCLTDQFAHKHGPSLEEAEELLSDMPNDYERAYYQGVAYERWGRAKLHEGEPATLVGDWLRRAMSLYDKADEMHPQSDQNAVLRSNACARLMKRIPELTKEREEQHEFGD